MNNTEHQREFRKRMRERGYKQKTIWVKKEGEPFGKEYLDRMDFMSRVDTIMATHSMTKKNAVYKKALAYIAELAAPKPGTR